MNIFSLYFPIFLSLSFSFFLSFLLSTIISMFKKNMHSVLALDKPHLNCHHHISSLVGGLGLITAVRDVKRSLPRVLEPVAVKSAPPSSPTGRIVFTDNIGGDVDGLVSCTESLGFESSDERQVDDPIEEININDDDDDDRRMRMIMAGTRSGNWRKVGHEKKDVKLFPPPLSSLNRNGRPCFSLRPVRKDGRLELFQVRIQRPEILHASREDGRLRLHLISDENILDGALLEEEEEEGEELQEHEEEEEEMTELKQEEAEIKKKSYERDEENVGEWELAMGTEGLRRCHEMVNHHHRHHLQMCGVSIV